MLTYVPVTTKNYKQAINIQSKIFKEKCPDEIFCSCCDAEYSIYNYAQYWLIKENNKTIGITGLYSFSKYPDDVFMNWFGIIPLARNHGNGTKALIQTIKFAKEKNFKTFRLYTEVGDNDKAIKLYKKNKLKHEVYAKEPFLKNMIIFSYPLTKAPAKKWNNKYIAIWEAYLLYSNNVWEVVKSNFGATIATIIMHPLILYRLILKKIYFIKNKKA